MTNFTSAAGALFVVAFFAAAAGAADPLSNNAIDARIRKHRTADVTLTLRTPGGKPLSGAEVTVEMVRHKFLFGAKGHPLCWHELQPRWLKGKGAGEVEKLQLARIEREVKAFTGLIDTWDVLNEVVVMPKFNRAGQTALRDVCRKLGQVGLISKCFAVARKTDPKATLLLNDYQLGPNYEKLIKDSLAAGVTIDAIGLQSHMHTRYRGARWGWSVCERFAKFGKPLHFTELTILSGDLKKDGDWHKKRTGWRSTPAGEKRQAAQVVEFYRVLYSHPAVEAITWWDFSDARAWQGAPAGLVRKDMSPKPAYTDLHKLVKGAWWTAPTRLRTDAEGKSPSAATSGPTRCGPGTPTRLSTWPSPERPTSPSSSPQRGLNCYLERDPMAKTGPRLPRGTYKKAHSLGPLGE